MKKILVVEDEPSIVTLIAFHLEKAGYKAIISKDGKSALTKVEHEKPDLILLDSMIPGMNGIEIVKQLRHEQKSIPIILLTTQDDEVNKMIGLDVGVDDFITKPFSPREVVARVQSWLRRVDASARHGDQTDSIQVGQVRICPEKYQVFVKDQQIEVTTKQFELLLYLMKNKGKVLTREQLLQHVWNYDFLGESRIVDIHISHLREKIEDDSKRPKYIKTIRGVGYKFEEPIL